MIRIQPDEAIYLKINNKVPGLGLHLDVTKLDLTYRDRFQVARPHKGFSMCMWCLCLGDAIRLSVKDAPM